MAFIACTMNRVVLTQAVFLLLLLLVGVTLCVRDPYTKTEPASAEVNSGATIGVSGPYLVYLGTGDYVGYKKLNFSLETLAFVWRINSNNDVYNPDNIVSLRLDSPTTQPFLTHIIPSGGGYAVESTVLIPVDKRPRGVHDLYFTFHHPDHLVLYWFRFVSLESLLPPATTLCPNATTAIDCPTPPPIDCPTPQPTTCPQPIPCPQPVDFPQPIPCPTTCPLTTPSSVQRPSEDGVSVEHKCDNATDRSNNVVINFY